MLDGNSARSSGRKNRSGLWPWRFCLSAHAALFCLTGGVAVAAPVVITAPFSANPGDFITLQGSGFGAAPRVFIQPVNSATVEAPVTQGQDNIIAVRIPAGLPFSAYKVQVYDGKDWSAVTTINAPQPHQFGNADIAPGQATRIYGRNLYFSGATPSVTLVDIATNDQLQATIPDNASQSLFITYIPPSGVIPGHLYKAVVSNGYASATTDDTTVGHAAGNDYFQVGEPWAFDFVTTVHNVMTDPSLTLHPVGDGVVNDAPAIQAAVDTVWKTGGGIVYLPAGTYNLGTTGVDIRPGTVLQGHSAADTTIIYGPTTQQGSSFSMNGVEVPDYASMTGIADLTIRNADTASQKVSNFGTRGGTISKFFIKRVNWDLGSGAPISLRGDRISISNSNFQQAINYQGGDATTGGLGPFRIVPVTNFAFNANSVKWATHETLIDLATNAVITSNHFTRSASDTVIATRAAGTFVNTGKPVAVGDVISRKLGRPLAMEFGKNIVLYGNTFDVSDGVLKNNLNDGETLLNESRGREDTGVVTSADSTSVSADGKCSGTCTWVYYPNSIVFIVSGAGTGQWRHITQKTGNTFTVDRPWDVIPASGDHFAMAVPSFENAIIGANVMSDNAQGIVLWGGAFLNVIISGNQLTNNNGISVHPRVTNVTYSAAQSTFSVAKNIEIKSNIVTDTNSSSTAHINVGQALLYGNGFWGAGEIGTEVRGNQVNARAATYPYLYQSGYQSPVYYQSPTPYVEAGGSTLLGTVFQGNSCTNCPIAFSIDTGDLYTIIWNNSINTSPGVSSTPVKDVPLSKTTTVKSVGTIFGHD